MPVPIPIPPYNAFLPSAPVIPKLYWDTFSQEQRIHRICEELCKICEYANNLGIAINLDHEIIEELQSEFEKFKASGFDDYYKEQIEAWIAEHFTELMREFLNHGVYFGLTDDGYFCANVVWQLTTYYDTIMDYASDDYGRLVLNY